MNGWLLINAGVSILLGVGMGWLLAQSRVQAALAAARSQFDTLTDRCAALELAAAEQKADYASLSDRHVGDCTARASTCRSCSALARSSKFR